MNQKNNSIILLMFNYLLFLAGCWGVSELYLNVSQTALFFLMIPIFIVYAVIIGIVSGYVFNIEMNPAVLGLSLLVGIFVIPHFIAFKNTFPSVMLSSEESPQVLIEKPTFIRLTDFPLCDSIHPRNLNQTFYYNVNIRGGVSGRGTSGGSSGGWSYDIVLMPDKDSSGIPRFLLYYKNIYYISRSKSSQDRKPAPSYEEIYEEVSAKCEDISSEWMKIHMGAEPPTIMKDLIKENNYLENVPLYIASLSPNRERVYRMSWLLLGSLLIFSPEILRALKKKKLS